MEKHIKSFECVDSKDITYIVEEYAAVIDAGHMQDPHAKIFGMRRFVLDDGRTVNFKGNGIYQITGSGVEMRAK